MSDTISQAISLDIDAYINLAVRLSPDQPVCVQGPAGIGKSESTDQIAALLRSDFYKDAANCERMTKALAHNKSVQKVLKKHRATVWQYEFGLPVIMRRLSQITEGDIVGIPYKKERENRVSTQFLPTDWLLDACDYPCILFLDERNRALEGVKQAVFEIQDSKAFYGNSLHEETRVYVAENIGDQFNVQQLDPAEISRVALIHLKPSVKAWCKWAGDKQQGNVFPLIVEYIRQNEGDLEHTKAFEAGKKYPDRRGWTRLSRELEFTGLTEDVNSLLFYQITATMVGPEIATKFWNYCKERDKQVSAEDIVTDWAKAKKRAGGDTIPAAFYIELARRLGDWLKKNVLTKEQAEQVSAFMHDAPPEPRTAVWLDANSNKKSMFTLLPLVTELIARTAGAQGTATQTAVAPPKQK